MPRGKLHAGRRAGRPATALIPGAHPALSRAAPAETAEIIPGPLSPPALAALPAFYLAELSGNLIYANPAYHGLVEQVEKSPTAAARLHAIVPLKEIIAEIETGGEPVVREVSFGNPPHCHLRTRHAGLYDAGGRLTAVVGTFEDIRDLVATRHKLSITHERLEDITRLASDWIWETDTKLAVTFVSPRITEVLGFQPIELLGRSFLALGTFTNVLPDAAHPLDPDRRTPFRDLPFTMAHQDGSTRLFHVSSLPVFCPLAGDFLGFRGTARDVTAQVAASDLAAQSQSQLSQAIESISEGFALFDPDDRLVLCNDKFRGTFPNPEAMVVPGAHFSEIINAALEAGEIVVAEEDRAAWLAERLRLRSEPRVTFEIEMRDGRWLKVSDHKTADGSTVGIRTDITDLKHREEALFAAKETAEIASRSKSEFLANISHELRTPLNAIIGFSEIMREQIFGPLGSPQYLEYIGDVLDSAHHLLGVINDILDIAKAEAGKLDLAEDAVDIAAVVRSATRLVHERAQRGQVTIRARLPDDLPLVHADERKLKQILLNLLTNSVKFTPSGGVIETAARLSETGDFLLTVSDTGIGIAPDDIAIALSPFGQVDSKLNRKYEGTGLGLPLSNAMIKLHGGELSIESVVGSGTTITIRLPAARVRQE